MEGVRVFLIRHGETAGPRGVLYSQQDVPLSERGLEQSRRLVDGLREISLTAVYASDLERAALPARWLAEERQIPLHLRPGLREIDFGAWSGKSFAELLQIPEFSARLEEPEKISPPGGESLLELQERGLLVLEEIRQKFCGGTVAVFTHGGLIRVLLLHALGAGLRNFFRLQQDYAAVNLLDIFPQGSVVRLVNGPFDLNFKLLLERDTLV
ncbi:MAG: histidine phosphatase family protein [Thermodesulfobacteria bacterium]|nr:histidine phosphatase family protein [Thermodesulfobacteriota bacterium]